MSRPPGVPAVDPLYADIRRRDPVRPSVVLDVRERDEIARVRVEGCLFIPMSELGGRLDEVPRDQPVLVLCNSGNRSMNVAAYLLANGWTDVANVAGGISTWERMGLPVTRGAGSPGLGPPNR
jgi:rhodanese-related sulfurtransferase